MYRDTMAFVSKIDINTEFILWLEMKYIDGLSVYVPYVCVLVCVYVCVGGMCVG